MIEIITFFSDITPENRVAQLTQKLAGTGAHLLSSDQNIDGMGNCRYLFIGSGGTENKIAAYVDEMRPVDPVILLAHESGNSLPAAMETRSYLQQKGIVASVVHAPMESLTQLVSQWCKFDELATRLSDMKIGIIGKPSSWLIASNVDFNRVKERWGVAITQFPLEVLTKGAQVDLKENTNSDIEKFVSAAKHVDVPAQDIQRAGQVTQALMEFVEGRELDAVTLQCFSLFEETDITGCYALSHLNGIEGLVAGCEGDIPTTFTLLIAKLLTQKPGFMANVVEVDTQYNTVVLAHCTTPTEILSGYDITTHFETDSSVAIRGFFENQPVTMMKVFGDDLSDYWVSSGQIVEHQYTDAGCRTQVKVKLDEPVQYFLEESLANHHVVIMGNHTKIIRDFFSFILGEL